MPINQGIGMTSIRTRLRLIETLRAEGIKNEEVLAAMEKIPRHLFVDSAISHRAYENCALPIKLGQTISQPFTVARITELLLSGLEEVGGRRHKVLEIGSGSGYQAAVLSLLFDKVYGIERIAELFKNGQSNLARMDNIQLIHKDGNEGWEGAAPFDGIIISAATKECPEQLLAQLSQRGCMVFPYGGKEQQRLRLVKYKNGRFTSQDRNHVLFVPLLSGKV